MGIFYLVDDQAVEAMYETGPEYQVLDDAGWPQEMEPDQYTDGDWEARKAAGKWAEVPQYGLAKSGHIGLQNAGKVVYRNIKIRSL